MSRLRLDYSKALELELNKLITGENGLRFYLQPIVFFKNRTLFAYEVLSRGACNTCLQEISPFDYAAEYSIGKQLDKVAFTDVFKVIDAFPGDTIFLNTYLSNLGALYEILKKSKTTKKIAIEIDFSTELVDINSVLEKINALNRLDYVSFAIDDLGKYSLDKKLYAIILPKYLKVDICVTTGICDDFSKQKALDDIILLSDEINAKLIIEGLEHREDAEYVKKQGVELAQGNMFQKPLEYGFFKK